MLPWWLERVLGIDVRRPDAEALPRPLLKTRRRSHQAHPDGVVSAAHARLVEQAYTDLSLPQRRAWLVAIYDGVVRTSGHAEYFRTHGVGRAAEARMALEELALPAARGILDEAIQRHVSVPGETGFVEIGSSRRFVPPRFDDLDAAYRALTGQVEAAVRRDVRDRVDDFVLVED